MKGWAERSCYLTLSTECSSPHLWKRILADKLHTLHHVCWFLLKHKQFNTETHRHLQMLLNPRMNSDSPGCFILSPGLQTECFSAVLHPVLSVKLLQKNPLRTSQTASDVDLQSCFAKRPSTRKQEHLLWLCKTLSNVPSFQFPRTPFHLTAPGSQVEQEKHLFSPFSWFM